MGQTTYRDLRRPQTFREEYGFDPIHLIDLKALMGDSSDNIPGRARASARRPPCSSCTTSARSTACTSISRMSASKRARAPSCRTASSPRGTASGWRPSTAMLPLELDVEHLPAQDIDETALYDLLTRLEFKNFIKRFDLSGRERVRAASAGAENRTSGECARSVQLNGFAD